jgi:hypothetical protein
MTVPCLLVQWAAHFVAGWDYLAASLWAIAFAAPWAVVTSYWKHRHRKRPSINVTVTAANVRRTITTSERGGSR